MEKQIKEQVAVVALRACLGHSWWSLIPTTRHHWPIKLQHHIPCLSILIILINNLKNNAAKKKKTQL